MSTSTPTSTSTSSRPTLAIATRLHLGQSSHPPPPAQLSSTLSSFSLLASQLHSNHAVVAVDADSKLPGYNLVHEVESILKGSNVRVLPVQPWGKFVPALNAIVGWAGEREVQCLLLVSAEVGVNEGVMDRLWGEMDLEDTLVVGPALQGHLHSHDTNTPRTQVELTGRTSPWNTLALWNLPKLSLTGFLQVSEGLHPPHHSSGIEEVCTIATLQSILPTNTALAKLVGMAPGAVMWGQDFEGDEGRREWHERKMRSKEERAERQLDLLGLRGTVIHC